MQLCSRSVRWGSSRASHCAPAPLEQAGLGIPDMWHVAIQWSLGTDENVTGLAGIPGTTYGSRGDKSLRTGAWLGENPLFITGKVARSVLGPCPAAEVGGKGCAAAEDLETHLFPRSWIWECFCRDRFG